MTNWNLNIISWTKIVIEVDINKCNKLYNWSIFNDIILKDDDKIYNELKLMTSLFYMLMKLIIQNKLFVAQLTIENDRSFFNEHDVRYVLIVVQIIVIIFFLIYVLFNFDENDVVSNFLKRLVPRFVVVILFVFEINEQQKFIFWFNIFCFVVINSLRSTLLIVVN